MEWFEWTELTVEEPVIKTGSAKSSCPGARISEAMIGPEVVTTSGDGVSTSRTFIVAVYVSTLCSPGANLVKEEVTHSLLVAPGRLDLQNKVATSSIIGSWQLKG